LVLRNFTQLLIGFFLIGTLLAGLSVSAQSVAQTYQIAINKTSYPYHFVDNEKHANGMMVELWRLWAKKQNVKVVFVPLTWKETIKQVQNGAVDIHAGLSKTANRAEILDLGTVFFRQNRHLFLHRSIAHIRELSQLSPYTVGVVAGSSHVISLPETAPNLTLKYYPDRHTLYKAAIAGEVLVIAGIERLSKNFPDYELLNEKYPAFARIPYDTTDYGTAVAKGNRALLDFIDQGMQKISAKEKSAIEKKWLGMDRSDNVITLSYFNNQMPFTDTSTAGNARGFFIELWQMWAKFSGLQVEFVIEDVNPSEQIDQDVADIDMTNVVNDNSTDDKILGPAIYSIDYGLFLSNDIDSVIHISEIQNKTIGVISTLSFVKDIHRYIKNANFVYFDDYKSLFEALERSELDIIAGQHDVIEHYLIQSKLQSTYSHYPAYSFKRSVHATLSKTNPELSRLITEGFNEIPLDNLVALEKKWNLDQSSAFFERQLTLLTLTDEESLWVKEHNVVKFGITRNWVPIEFVDKYGEFKGTNPDLFQLITERLNLKIEYVVYDNFAALYAALLTGEIDALGSIMNTEARKKEVLFTESYWSMPWVIIHPRELGKKLDLDSFSGKTLAITKGYYLVSVIRKEFPSLTLRLVDDSEEGLLAVQKGMVDGFIDNLSSGTELLKRESLVGLSMSVLDEVDRDGNHLAINKSLPILAKVLNKAVLTISDAESQKIYEQWFDISVETGLDKKLVLRVAAQVGVLIVIVIIIIMVWNRRLYLEIRNRRKLEKQMKYMATHDDLTGLANRVLLKDRLNTAITFHQRQSLLLAVLFIDLDGFKNINDNYGHDVGDELLIEIANRLNGCVRESDTVVRFGGDEFVLLLTGLHNQDEAAYIADKVLKLIQQPVPLSAVNVTIGCSIGIAMYPDDGDSDNELLKVADSLMYNAKAAGKNHYVFNRKDSQTV
jgi:diguanylate cyclase (GGDEF)-like protein